MPLQKVERKLRTRSNTPSANQKNSPGTFLLTQFETFLIPPGNRQVSVVEIPGLFKSQDDQKVEIVGSVPENVPRWEKIFFKKTEARHLSWRGEEILRAFQAGKDRVFCD
ncbi:uncharacterized protein BDCG_17936 [Blastomyces dermatitidis ER-3]|uniref:Uncharacterized protein n=1 Tax=Ajellomyces dermatitidis (strain ER-3 / ATCC MYA-2586) TaxID=559297 RepID=A0ABX2W163_AJEDR|nr:uncharacterized protein BDCG_17936 [Blastomyces dermatitidis ER-3]EQL32811.1 hypothetical protein BDFG_05063 [Blastomyces dermatitidis ATCC 26199]OAT03128.1 hypothetical protein BDCG_17936 [Blastomyces dermatitidis ER-3]